MRRSTFRARSFSGLTLVELLGAVSVVMVLTSVALMGLKGIKEYSEEGRARNNIRTLNEALERFASRGGDPNKALNGNDGDSPENLIDTLRSTHPAMLSMGGPFLDADRGPVMGGDGTWRVIARKLNLHFNADNTPALDPRTNEPRTTVFFELMDPEGKIRKYSSTTGPGQGGVADGSLEWVDSGLGANVQGIVGFEPKAQPAGFEPKGAFSVSTSVAEFASSPLTTFGRDSHPAYAPPAVLPTPPPLVQGGYWR